MDWKERPKKLGKNSPLLFYFTLKQNPRMNRWKSVKNSIKILILPFFLHSHRAQAVPKGNAYIKSTKKNLPLFLRRVQEKEHVRQQWLIIFSNDPAIRDYQVWIRSSPLTRTIRKGQIRSMISLQANRVLLRLNDPFLWRVSPYITEGV